MKVIKAFFMCMGMFSAIPCPYRPWDEDARELMTACLPLVGAVIGALWYLSALVGRLFLPQTLCAALIAAMPFLLTGFMHLDGFMDSADALLSWRPLELRQKILKDVHCGSFSVVAVVLLMIGMFAAANDAMNRDLRVLMLIPVASRCMSAFCVTMLKPIGHSEYSALKRSAGTPIVSAIILMLTAAVGWVWLGCAAAICIAAVLAGYAAAMAWAASTMKGVSGDLAGYSLCVGELCGLAMLAIL